MKPENNSDLTIKRRAGGTWQKGQSGNPSGPKKKPKLSAAEARQELPQVVKTMITMAVKDKGWLETLKKDYPDRFAALLLSLNRYSEADSPPAVDTSDHVEYASVKESVADGVIELVNQFVDAEILPDEYRNDPVRAMAALAIPAIDNEVVFRPENAHETETRIRQELKIDGATINRSAPPPTDKPDKKDKSLVAKLRALLKQLFPGDGDDFGSYDRFVASEKKLKPAARKYHAELDEAQAKMLAMSDDPDDDNFDPRCAEIWQ